MRHEESDIQIAFVRWLSATHPDALFTTCLAGVNLSMTAALRVKRMGYRCGTSDVLILEPRGEHHGLFLEIKTSKGKPSPTQLEFSRLANARGYKSVIVYGFYAAVDVSDAYLSMGPTSAGISNRSDVGTRKG